MNEWEHVNHGTVITRQGAREYYNEYNDWMNTPNKKDGK